MTHKPYTDVDNIARKLETLAVAAGLSVALAVQTATARPAQLVPDVPNTPAIVAVDENPVLDWYQDVTGELETEYDEPDSPGAVSERLDSQE